MPPEKSGGILFVVARGRMAASGSTSCAPGSCCGSGWRDCERCWSDCGCLPNVPDCECCGWRSSGGYWCSSGCRLIYAAGSRSPPCDHPSSHLSSMSSCCSSFPDPSHSSCRHQFPCSPWPRPGAQLPFGTHPASRIPLRYARLDAFACWCKRTYPRVA